MKHEVVMLKVATQTVNARQWLFMSGLRMWIDKRCAQPGLRHAG